MQITTRTDHALRLLIYLHVSPKRSVEIGQIAQSFDISANHLAKVAQSLVRAGWIDSVRGRGGGLSLNPLVYRVSIGTIFRHTEANLCLVECFGDNCQCKIEPACGLKALLAKARDAFLRELDQHYLGDLVLSEQEIRVLLSQ